MAGNIPVQAEVHTDGVNLLKHLDFCMQPWGRRPRRLTGKTQGRLFAGLGMAVIVTAQAGGDKAGGAVADRAAVYAHDRHHDLTRRGDKRLPRGVRFLDRKSSLFEGQSLILNDVDNN